ncbi:MAG TPA: sensor histidine kinase [Dermatophilaceae bacterium]|nr:sensor histidine kinase [Dermatophilaceae bacterium]
MIAEQVVRPPWIRVAAGTSARMGEAAVQPRRVFAQVIAGALVVLGAVAVAGVAASQRLAEAEAVNDAAKTANLLADVVAQPALSEALLTSDASAVAAMDQVVRAHVLSPTIVRVKIWDPTGLILYSDAPDLIGERFPLGAEERDVLTHPQTRADVSDLTSPENRLERGHGRLLEVYRPIWTPSGKPVLFEIYAVYDEVTSRTGQLWRGFAGVTLTSLLMLVVLLMPILWRLLDRLKRSQEQREALLHRAVEASTEERRRIAGALHDGVVQELAATSFAVAGTAERAESLGQPGLANEIRSAAGTVRNSIGGLRSLLLDIYPPSLATAGLEAALTDLASNLRSRGPTVTVELAPQTGLDAEGERLVFRVARECLNNIARHAAATNVELRLDRVERHVVMEIIDNGVGFDAAELVAHPAEGHFGLRVLGDVVAEAGGELLLSSAPGMGTRWQLRIPLA